MKSSHKKMFKKRIAYLAIAAWGCLVSGPVWAAPQGGVVTSGTATINQSGHVTNINQATQRAAINWQSFSTRPQETVNFHQPNAAAIALNRVIGNERSILEGALNANGRVFLINSNGIIFAKGSTVNTAGFIASTLNLTDKDFNAGSYVFKKNNSTGSVINMGTITAKEGGYVALLGPAVSNQGVIAATRGSVALASGDKVTLNFNGDSLVNVTVDQGTLNALVENKEAVYADGGKVILTAKAADDLLGAQVNNSGIIQARTINDLKGSITLYAHGGTAAIDGTLDASAPITGDGGFIETSGDRVKIADTAFITTKSATGTNGTWLIDPTDFTIGDGGDITGTLISNFLKGTDITIQSTMGKKGTEGDINVNEGVSWSANTKLALNAATDINVNAPVKATGANAGLALTAGKDINVNKDITLSGTNAALTMNYGGDYHIFMPTAYAGAVLDKNGRPTAKKAPEGTTYAGITLPGSNAGLTMNGTPYTLIHSVDQLAAQDDATGTATGSYALAQDLDAAAWSAANMGATSVVAKLSGTLSGLGHTISNLTLNASTKNFVGLIGQIPRNTTAVVRDIGMKNVNITGKSSVGALLGASRGTVAISDAYITATDNNKPSIVSAWGGGVGGLIGGGGKNFTMRDSFSDADVMIKAGDGQMAGGLVGAAENFTTITTITNCHATGKVTSISSNGLSRIGGLVGSILKIAISNSYTTGDVMSTGDNVGGLCGEAWAGSVSNSFSTGNITGRDGVGGLVGDGGNIDNCWATGNVTGRGGLGGLVGSGGGYLTRSFATGDVRTNSTGGTGYLGGLAGLWKDGDITYSFATGNVIGNGRDGHGDGATAHMGGLVGNLRWGGSISDSYATGDVKGGFSYVGGLVGNGSNITRSWASGRVSVTPRGSCFGGLVGQGMNVSDSYWNADTTGQSNAIGHTAAGYVPTNTKGLTNAQWKDLPYYRNGTIDQVLADRAAAAQAAAYAAARQAAFKADARGEAGHATGRSLQQDADPSRETGTAGMLADGDRSFTPLNKHIVLHDSYDHSVYMKTIGAKGAHFGLEGSSSGKKKEKIAGCGRHTRSRPRWKGGDIASRTQEG